MPKIFYKAIPFNKEEITLALESGIDGILVEEQYIKKVQQLARIEVFSIDDFPLLSIKTKEDEEKITSMLLNQQQLIIASPWQIIPLENILAQTKNVTVEVHSLVEAKLALGILECGVHSLVVSSKAKKSLKEIIAESKIFQSVQSLIEAEITEITPIGLGHRVCIDTINLLKKGQGMLVGNSSSFTFLVHAETEENEYVAARPFRINAGAIHSYTYLPENKTCYLEELRAGDRILIVNSDSSSSIATVGRAKTEMRPMLKISAEVENFSGSIFLQNAETIRLSTKNNQSISVVDLKIGDKVLCKLDKPGRHFGMPIDEEISEL